MASSNLTQNINLLKPTGFKLTIDSSRFANTEFFITNATIPGISLSQITTQFRGHNSNLEGEPLEYESFSITCKVDEDLRGMIEIFEWMKRNADQEITDFVDLTLTVLTSHNNANVLFNFRNAFPIQLSGFDLTVSDDAEPSINITFAYDYYEIEKLNN